MRIESLDAAAMIHHLQTILRRNTHTKRIIPFARSRHQLQRIGIQHLAAKQSLLPLKQIASRRIHRTRSPRHAHRLRPGHHNPSLTRMVSLRPLRQHKLILVKPRVLHAQRIENALMQHLHILLPTHLLNYRTQHLEV